ncbi:MAG TPA: nitronate monooxygenase [bacterium]|nr:nitronate monooxygenase [bacterium]
MKNRICELLGIRYPIIGAGMVWWSNARLCAAIADTGCLGLLAGGSHTPEQLAEAIDQVRAATDGVFGVNIPLLYSHAQQLIETAVEKGVRIFFTSAGSPKKFTDYLHEHGCVVVHVVPSTKLAVKCAAAGVDALVAEGCEGGGHLSPDEVASMVLWPAVADAVDIPVIAAGGIADARAMVAAFALGADAVQVGTRFIASAEADGSEEYIQRLLTIDETGTEVTGRAFGAVRGIANELTAAIREMERAGKSSEEILAFVGAGRARAATLDDDVDWGSMQCGQVAGLVHDRPPVLDLVRRFVEEYPRVCERVLSMDPR